ncbi:5'-methylthioadenosine phosphorylase [Candidatus Nitrosoglobus terrae]|uniref:Probable S-methyl-5'-thioinosine phosphorylase n=1 Tax=Candidatus Nitrosoglobus terrae TaxID=1630141 RepID=A0A1Q2SL24_9GAMM|nr:S-methyl-5'-thioinosine phosphorylase [Candidatus Nitrosoglobus terrae]BAW79828.1 5'-methylthioadenosine phosphorylase [Candidatus Nitrosoglobus terrae]
MANLAIIGGTGLTALKHLEITQQETIGTPFGEPSSSLVYGRFYGKEIVFLPRHGFHHSIPPHKINYRANLWALKEIGITQVVAIAAVGGINSEYAIADLIIPDQIIDYTWGRAHTFYEQDQDPVVHIDFTHPYSEGLRNLLLKAALIAGLNIKDRGIYGAVQGPRLEAAAEINRLERDGCHMVGMTGMPEAALARELGLNYAAVAVIANPAAGRGEGIIEMSSIEQNLKLGMGKVLLLLEQLISLI